MRLNDQVYSIMVGGVHANDRRLIDALAECGIDGATLTEGVGVWQGNVEPQVTLTIGGATEGQIEGLSVRLCYVFKQECVYVIQHGNAKGGCVR